jgi:hypothetical protein
LVRGERLVPVPVTGSRGARSRGHSLDRKLGSDVGPRRKTVGGRKRSKASLRCRTAVLSDDVVEVTCLHPTARQEIPPDERVIGHELLRLGDGTGIEKDPQDSNPGPTSERVRREGGSAQSGLSAWTGYSCWAAGT